MSQAQSACKIAVGSKLPSAPGMGGQGEGSGERERGGSRGCWAGATRLHSLPAFVFVQHTLVALSGYSLDFVSLYSLTKTGLAGIPTLQTEYEHG